MVSLENRRHISVFGELLKSITLSTHNHDEKQLNSVPRITKYLICDLSKHHVLLEIHSRHIYCRQVYLLLSEAIKVLISFYFASTFATRLYQALNEDIE